jgi:hypothetical protein
MYTIPRKKLVKIAFKVLAQADDEGAEISAADRGHLLYAACTVEQIALGSWVINKNCGCLVGSMLLAETKPSKRAELDDDTAFALADSRGLLRISWNFDDRLRDYIHAEFSDEPSAGIVRVKD